MDSGYQPIIDICLKYGAISDIDKSWIYLQGLFTILRTSPIFLVFLLDI
jgi:hypothetical protein